MLAHSARLSVVLITFNRRQEVLRTMEKLAALKERPPLIVVDNGSTDGTPQAVMDNFPDAHLIAAGRNLGFAGRNLGVQAARTPYVAFADDDSWWQPGTLARAVQLLDEQPRLALLTGRVLVGPHEREDPLNELLAQSPLPRAPGMPGTSILGFLACAAIVRRTAFLEAGGFHHHFLVGGEEELLAMDLARRGWWLCYVPELVAYHDPSPARNITRRRAREIRNRLWCVWLRRPLASALRLTIQTMKQCGYSAPLRGFTAALLGLPWVIGEREVVPAWLERQFKLLEGPALLRYPYAPLSAKQRRRRSQAAWSGIATDLAAVPGDG